MVLLKNHDCENYDVHVLSKAIAVLSKFHCGSWKQTKLLYFSDILGCLAQIMHYGEMATSRESALLCLEILKCPEEMVVWLKFASPRLTINSACTEDYFVQWGDPHRLPDGRGLYRNWGAFFDFNDVIEVPGGVQVPGAIMRKWTISFWMILPLSIFNTGKRHVLV